MAAGIVVWVVAEEGFLRRFCWRCEGGNQETLTSAVECGSGVPPSPLAVLKVAGDCTSDGD